MAEHQLMNEKGGRKHGEDSVKLFVGQVPKHMSEADLLAVFEEVAAVDEVNIIRNKTTKTPRGCCFVICPSRQEADKAVEAFHNNKTLPGASSPLQVKYADGELERLEHKLFVGMLPKNVSEAELSALFSQYGTVKELQILRGAQQTSKACAFLKYDTKDQALAALEAVNGKHKMEGSNVPLVVKWADTERERHVRKAQKAQFQASKLPVDPSLFGAVPYGYLPPYNGYGYQAPGSYGVVPYRPPPNQPPFPDNFPTLNQGNGMRSVRPSVPNMQYPAYPARMMNERPLHGSNSPMAANANSRSQLEGPPGSNLFIYHLPQEYGDQDLANAFQPFGRVISVKVFVDKTTGMSKCFGFVSYDTPTSAQNAIKVMNGYQLGSKKLKVQLKRDNKQKQSYA
ncbi:hypothetical protein V2J09_021205 [Rumex salicifolius]